LKLFSFNASSFALESSVEDLLKSKGAIVRDFGSFAYINSDAMPAILSDLLARSSAQASQTDIDMLVNRLKSDLAISGSDRQKLLDENRRLESQLQVSTKEAIAYKSQLNLAVESIKRLEAETTKFSILSKSDSASRVTSASSDLVVKQSYERSHKELQALKAQYAEAITSLKVLEDENGELRDEVEMLRIHAKNPQAPKADNFKTYITKQA